MLENAVLSSLEMNECWLFDVSAESLTKRHVASDQVVGDEHEDDGHDQSDSGAMQNGPRSRQTDDGCGNRECPDQPQTLPQAALDPGRDEPQLGPLDVRERPVVAGSSHGCGDCDASHLPVHGACSLRVDHEHPRDACLVVEEHVYLESVSSNGEGLHDVPQVQERDDETPRHAQQGGWNRKQRDGG